MATPQQAQQEVMDALVDHFARTSDKLTPEQITEMTALSLNAVRNALRVLLKANRIEGIEVAEADYPVIVTGVVYG